jgi:microcystin-dependent protein
MDPFIGQIILFAGNFAPRGFAFCHGQLLTITTNTALFSILGTTYGGDGRTTFGLPDLRGRVPVQQGPGPGLTSIMLGQKGGVEQNAMNLAHLPAHSHAVNAGGEGNLGPATNNFPAGMPRGETGRYIAAKSTTMNRDMIETAGQGQPLDNRQPFLGLNYCIALQGIFPSRN